MRSILYPRLIIDGKREGRDAIAGYSSDIGEYVLCEEGIWLDEMYFIITADECERILACEDEILRDPTGIILKNQVPDYFQRMTGAAGPRLHCIKSWPKGFRPYISMHGPYLYDEEEKMLYWHLFWKGVHYAAAPHFFSPYGLLNMRPEKPLREIEGLNLCRTEYGGEEIIICYGKQINEFDGMEEWQQLYEHIQNGGEWNW